MLNININLIIIYGFADFWLVLYLSLNYYYLNWVIYPITFSKVQYFLACFQITLYLTAGVYCIELLNPDVCLIVYGYIILYLLSGLLLIMLFLLSVSPARFRAGVSFRLECYFVNTFKKFKYLC